MVLMPEFKWSIPQKNPPVCVPGERCEVMPVTDQSSLLGTLLSQVN